LEQVSAFDGGDAAALIIGLILGIMGICACLGAYARRQQGVWRRCHADTELLSTGRTV